MTHFSDELLSAYLDGELSAEERAAVKSRLAESEADRRLLEELQALRSELQSLPRAELTSEFTDRVVRAAAESQEHINLQVTPAAADPGAGRTRRFSWPLWTAAVAAGLAICAVLIVRNWPLGDANVVVGPGPIPPTVPSPAELLIAQLRQAAPTQDEAVVIRLRVPKNSPLGPSLDVALAEAGIRQRPAFDLTSGAIELGAAYRKQVQQKPANDLVAVSDALFLNAPLSQIEEALAAIAGADDRALRLAAETRLALADLPKPQEGPEGEPGSENAGGPFSQRLNAGMFRLEKRESAAAWPTDVVPAALNPQQTVKLLILIEQVD
ncbi:MAG TPA: zf-HC2 domain-containing protein [Pirellulaceae bacterium]|nr:zf-HC2 domain-containing protein [Pirellulaceae bacterium]